MMTLGRGIDQLAEMTEIVKDLVYDVIADYAPAILTDADARYARHCAVGILTALMDYASEQEEEPMVIRAETGAKLPVDLSRSHNSPFTVPLEED